MPHELKGLPHEMANFVCLFETCLVFKTGRFCCYHMKQMTGNTSHRGIIHYMTTLSRLNLAVYADIFYIENQLSKLLGQVCTLGLHTV